MRKESSGTASVFFPSYDREEILRRLSDGLRRLPLPVKRAVLFGSQSTGRATAASDIDLLVVYADPKVENDYQLVRQAMNLTGLEPHVYTSSEAEMAADVIQRMSRDGIEIEWS